MKKDQQLEAWDHRYLWHPFTQQQDWVQNCPLIVEEAEGCWLIDTEGNRYLDGVSSLWTNVHGHGHPALNQALLSQMEKMAHSTLLGLTHRPAIEFAKRLVEVAPRGLERVFYSDNGSTSVEVALKMAFQYHQQTGGEERTRFACLKDGYHGDTLGAVSVGSIDLFHQCYGPLLFDAVSLPAPKTPSDGTGCLDEALRLIEEHGPRLAALVFEPLVQGAAGMKMHDVDYLQPILQAARRHGVLLIADEVAVGFGRTGTLFAMDQFSLSPDLMCLAKGIAGGYLPLAATLTTEVMYEAFCASPEANKQFFHGHTFTGNPLACAVALRSLELFFEEDVMGRVEALSRSLREWLAPLDRLSWVSDVRQKGLMVGIDLCGADGQILAPNLRAGNQVCTYLRGEGVILRPLGDTLVINPPLAISKEELSQLTEKTIQAIQTVMPSLCRAGL